MAKNKKEENMGGGEMPPGGGSGALEEIMAEKLRVRETARQDPRYGKDPLFSYGVDAEELVAGIKEIINPRGGFDAYVHDAYDKLTRRLISLEPFGVFLEKIDDIKDLERKYNCKTHLAESVRSLYTHLINMAIMPYGEGEESAIEDAYLLRSQLRTFLDGVHSILQVAENKKSDLPSFGADVGEVVGKIDAVLQPKASGGFESYARDNYAALARKDMSLKIFQDLSGLIKEVEKLEGQYHCKTYLNVGLRDLYDSLSNLGTMATSNSEKKSEKKKEDEDRFYEILYLVSRLYSEHRAFLNGANSVSQITGNYKVAAAAGGA